MNPLTGYVPLNQVQPGPGLMGNVLQPPSQSPSLMNTSPGDWSQVAYNMAGRPTQGPYPSVAAPPMPAGVNAGGHINGGGGGSIGGTALGLLGALAKNPSLLKSGANGISSLWNSMTGGSAAATGGSAAVGGGATAYGTDAGVTAGVSPLVADDVAATTGIAGAGLAPVGTGAIAPAVNSAAADASAALGASEAAPAAGGLLGAAIPSAAEAGASLGAGAPGVFATGNAAAGTGTAAAGGSLGAAGTAAVVAAPFIAQQLGLMLGDAWTGKNTQGNAAMKGWMNATGATWKPNYTNSGQNTFGTNNGLMQSSTNPGTMYDRNGNAMTPAQAASAIYNWAIANHVNPGDFHA